jgi:Tfp pilus assembly protein PilN
MIRVNLLPEEYRKVEKTPLSLFLLIVVGVAVVCLALLFCVYLFMSTGRLRRELDNKMRQRDTLQGLAKYADKLESELANYRKRLDTIMSIRASRIYWSKKLYLLAKNRPENVWFVSLKMEQRDPYPASAKPETIKDGGFLDLQGYQKSDDFKIYAGYRETLQKDRVFYSDFADPAPPKFKAEVWDKAVEEDQNTLWFQIILYLKHQAEFQQ